MIKKIVEPTGDLCIKFTEEELSKLGLKEGDKLSYEECDNGFLLKKYETIDIELDSFSREALLALVVHSIENNTTISESIEDILMKYCERMGIDAQQD